jgi:hypothetical protein
LFVLRDLFAKVLLKEHHSMADDLDQLIEAAKTAEFTADQREEQRRSFAYGNTKIENPRITRQTIDEQAAELERSPE